MVRIAILLLSFACLLNAALPTGTSYYVPITVSSAKVAGSESNFLYQIDMSAKLASDATFKSYITTAANIAVYDSAAGVLRPRDVTLDLATDKLLINFDAATSTSADKRFFICVGAGISETNSVSAYTNSGYAHRWGVDSATITNDLTGSTGTISGTVTTGDSGVYDKAVCITGTTSNVNLGNLGFFDNRTQFTWEYVFNAASYTGTGFMFYAQQSTSVRMLLAISTDKIVVYIGAAGNQFEVSLASFPTGSWHHIVIAYNGAGVTNSDKFKVFVNGAEQTVTFIGTMPTSITIAANYYFGHVSASREHCFDEVGLTSDIKTTTFATTRYNQFFDAGFWSVGDGAELAQITLNPVSTTCSLSQACTLFTAATGTSPLSGYWQDSLDGTVTTIPDSDNDSLMFTPELSDSGKYYRRVVGNDFGEDTSTWARLDVEYSDEATSVTVSPATARIDTMETQQFTAEFYDVGGRVSTNHDAVVWSTTASGATEGAIDEDGLFTAGSAAGGPYTVTATAGALTDDASVTVVIPTTNGKRGWSWRWRWSW